MMSISTPVSRRGLVAAMVAVTSLTGCASTPKHPKPPPGVSFGPRLNDGFPEKAEEVTGSEAAVIRFITAMRSRDAKAVAATGFGLGAQANAQANAQSLVQNYAALLAGNVTVTIAADDKGNDGRDVCLNFPQYPYQLVLFIEKGRHGTDDAHWLAGLGKIQLAPTPLKRGEPTPPPRHDKSTFCEDGFNVGMTE